VSLAADVAFYPDSGANAAALLSNAEIAIKHAKSQTDA
jgi:GGDEF domain-containing protein